MEDHPWDSKRERIKALRALAEDWKKKDATARYYMLQWFAHRWKGDLNPPSREPRPASIIHGDPAEIVRKYRDLQEEAEAARRTCFQAWIELIEEPRPRN
jgi:hypothetical protein